MKKIAFLVILFLVSTLTPYPQPITVSIPPLPELQ